MSKELSLKERILKVLMIFSILFAVGLPVTYVIDRGIMGGEFLQVTGIGVLVVFVTSCVQYILNAEWNPMYLFKKSGK
jgi:hypothetical protein